MTWRVGTFNGGNKLPLVYLPMHVFLNQVWRDISHKRLFTFRVWFGEGSTLPPMVMSHRAEYKEEVQRQDVWDWKSGEHLTQQVEEVPLEYENTMRYWDRQRPLYEQLQEWDEKEEEKSKK